MSEWRSRRLPLRAGLAALTGVLLALAYPPFAFSALGWVALAPLIAALDGAAVGTAAALGWLSGTVLGLGVAGHWLWHAAVDYFGFSAALAALFTFGLIQAFVAPFVAAFAIAVAAAGGGARWWLAPAAWVASEWLRATLVGNAWELLGHSQRALPLLQMVDVTGVYGLSLLLALAASALAATALAACGLRGAGARRGVAAAAIAAVVAIAYGRWRLADPPRGHGELRALVVQGDVANADRRPERSGAVLRRYLALSRSVAPVPPLVLWPENAIGVFPDANPALLDPVQAFARQASTAILSGAPRAGDRAGIAALYNAVYLVTGDALRPVYDKRRLLPFVERFALRPGDGPYLPGAAAAPLAVAGAHVGPLICFEVVYPELARGLVADGADVLLNFSNDSWFDAGAGPAQHFEMARFRSIENRVSIVRVTNSGISGAFGPDGRELARLPVGQAAAAPVTVPLRAGGSFYTRAGDWVAWLCLAATALGILARRRAG